MNISSLLHFPFFLGNTTATGGAKIEITELGADSGSENEEAEMHRTGQTKKQKTKKHFIHHNNQVSVFSKKKSSNISTDKSKIIQDPI